MHRAGSHPAYSIDTDALGRCLACGDDAALRRCLTRLLNTLPPGSLPLHQCRTHGGLIDEAQRTISVLGCAPTAWGIRVRAGVFFSEIVGGCNCADDPVAHNAYGVLRIDLHHADGRIEAAVVAA